MTQLKYNDPERDVRIDTAYRGDIRCRKLVIEKTGSVVGNIEAFDVRNFGRIQGIVNASDVFINSENAVMRGSLYAPHIGNHPKATIEGGVSNSHPFRTDYATSPNTPSDIDRAIDQGIKRELERAGFASDEHGFAISPNKTFARQASTVEQVATQETETFRTADGKEWPLPDNRSAFGEDLAWAPPVPTRTVIADGKELTVVSEPVIEETDCFYPAGQIEQLRSRSEKGPIDLIYAPPALTRKEFTAVAEPVELSGVPAPKPSPTQRRPLPPLFASAN
jgi:cytoskeletal protein CcmA (bactofilin family)|nr:polymer-forming cytoskeletal protein [Neorhizobium tomejilense]